MTSKERKRARFLQHGTNGASSEDDIYSVGVKDEPVARAVGVKEEPVPTRIAFTATTGGGSSLKRQCKTSSGTSTIGNGRADGGSVAGGGRVAMKREGHSPTPVPGENSRAADCGDEYAIGKCDGKRHGVSRVGECGLYNVA